MADKYRFLHRATATAGFTLLIGVLPSGEAAVQVQRWNLQALLELQAQSVTNGASWLEKGDTGLRFGSSDNALQSLLGVGVDYQINDTNKLHAAGIYYSGLESELALTESYWHLRPVPRSPWRQELKAGMFHLPGSLENSGPLWSSPYGMPPATVNTWLGEELRTLGAEWRWRHLGRYRQSKWDTELFGAVYGFNDTAGAMVAWRGWASHDRQAGIGSHYPIAPLPQLMHYFRRQKPEFEPFVEVDNRPGFYIGGMLSRQRTLQFNYLYYDNRADPTVLEQGQYGWRTRFHHAGLRWQLPERWELKAQFLYGDTLMGRRYTKVDADLWSGYIMASKHWGRHQLALRWDRFEVVDHDTLHYDENDEHGRSLAIAYSIRWQSAWKLSFSYTNWRSQRTVRGYLPGQQQHLDSNQWLLGLRYHW